MKIIIKNKNLSFLKFYLSSSFLAKRWWAKIASHYEKTGRKKIFFLQKIYFLDLFAYLFSVWTGKNKRPEHTLVAHFFFILKYIFKNKNAEKGRKINLGKSNIFTKIVLFSNLKIETVFFNWIRSQATRAPYYDKSQFDNQRKKLHYVNEDYFSLEEVNEGDTSKKGPPPTNKSKII